MDDAQLSELENLLEDSERRYTASGVEAKARDWIRRAEADAGLQRRQIDALTNELENLRGIRGKLFFKFFFIN